MVQMEMMEIQGQEAPLVIFTISHQVQTLQQADKM